MKLRTERQTLDLKAWADAHEPPLGREMARHYLRDLVYGAIDGIITTFAVVAGVAGANLAARTAIILGVANLVADGFSMGASNFLGIRSEEAVLAAQGEPRREPFPFRHALATFVAFILAGSLPLIPFTFVATDERFVTATVTTLAALFAVGALRSLVTNLTWWWAGLEMLTVGTLAALFSYGVGFVIAGVA